jgi:hypothetical protein
MPRKTTIFIAILAVVTAILVILAIRNEQSPLQTTNTAPTPTPTVTIPKTTNVTFLPTKIDASTGLPLSVDIIADTNSDQISGIQLELQYDPKLLTNVKITKPDNSLFGAANNYTVLFSEVNSTLGRISYAAAIQPTQLPISGVGKVATLTFQKATQINATPSVQTTISFIDKTMVTKLNEAQTVLNETNSLTIQLVTPPTPTASISAPAVQTTITPAQ